MGRAEPDVRPPGAAIPSEKSISSRNSTRGNGSRPTAQRITDSRGQANRRDEKLQIHVYKNKHIIRTYDQVVNKLLYSVSRVSVTNM